VEVRALFANPVKEMRQPHDAEKSSVVQPSIASGR
jgi:hypothetical protein